MGTPANPTWNRWPYRLGCPVWNCKHWQDEVYPDRTPARDCLLWYSRMFGTVEGNSTFYAVPELAVAKRWCTESPDSFCFAMKFPRSVSHDSKLLDCHEPMGRFLELLKVLQEHGRLGPSFLQLGPDFSSLYWERLKKFIDSLPLEFPFAVELRHRDWYDSDVWERRIDELLRERKIDRVLFDARPLQQGNLDDPSEKAAHSKKPKTPYRTTVTGTRPFLRLIGRNNPDNLEPWWSQWAVQVAAWIQQGLQPWVFTHAPDDRFAPRIARRFHELVQQHATATIDHLPRLARIQDSDAPVQQNLFEF